ncbi:MAG: DUF167 family protein [Methanolobus sp.]|nr:DUF167 family protein [Methanolobus sp.]
MSFEDALKKTDAGVLIDIEVTPGSKTISVPSGYNPWRKRIEVRLSENAHKDKANEQLRFTLADIFALKMSDVSIIRGMHSSKKSLLLANAEYSAILVKLKEKLPQHSD